MKTEYGFPILDYRHILIRNQSLIVLSMLCDAIRQDISEEALPLYLSASVPNAISKGKAYSAAVSNGGVDHFAKPTFLRMAW